MQRGQLKSDSVCRRFNAFTERPRKHSNAPYYVRMRACVLPLIREMGDYLSSLTFSLIGWFGFCLCSFQEQRSP